MPLSKTWNNTSYSIPQAGEINWAALTTFLSDLADNAQTSIFQKFAVRVATTSPVTVNAATDCVVISNLGVAGAVAVNLPAGATKQIFMIVDGKGDAATNNITITPAAGNINGAATYVMNVNNAGVALVYDGTQWTIFAEFTRFSSGSGIIPRSKIADGTADHVVINSGTGALSSEAQLASTRGGTGVSNAGTLTYGANNITITTSGATSLTVPTSGTVATLAGSESLSNKTLVSPLISGGSIDVTAAGALAIGASVGANNLTLGGATSTVIVSGDLTVSGTTTTINTATLDVEDANISVNVGGNDASSEGAGLRVARTGTAGSLIYAVAATSKWKVGALGAEVEVADISSAQAFTGKTIDSDSNTITNIVDGDIKSTAAIDRTKLASGTADHVVINNGSGVMSSEAQLASTRGGTGVNNSGTLTYGANNISITTSGATSLTVPTSGTVATLAGTETLSSKTLTAAKAGDYFDFTEVAAPSTPGSGFVRVYAKSDNKVYQKDDAGVESLLGGGSGSGSGEINIITNPSAATDLTGITDGTSHTTTRVTSGSPLDPVTTTAFSVAASTTAVESSTSGARFSPTMPTGLRNKKLKVDVYFTTEASQTWRLSVYANGTRLALSTDSSGATTLPAGTTGKFTTYFDANSESSYTVNVTRTAGSGTATLIMTSVIVGPGIQPQGSVVGDWITYTPVWSSTGTQPVVNNGTLNGVYRRVGDSAEVEILLLSGTTTTYGTGGYKWSLPSGLTVDTSKLPANYNSVGGAPVFGSATAGFSSFTTSTVTYDSTTTVTGMNGGSTWAATSPFSPSAATANNTWSLKFLVPISEWAGSGTVNLAQNDVDYAYNSSTTDANDSTSFAYGPSGGQYGNFSTLREKRVRFQTPIQSGDSISLEVTGDSGTTWIPVGQDGNVFPYLIQNSVTYGAKITKLNSTDVDVSFGQYRSYTGASYGSAGDLWSAIDADPVYKWRVKKVKSGQAVGFGHVNQTSSGLVKSAGQLLGTNTNDVAATGYVGEHLTSAPASLSATALTTTVYADVGSITLTSGDWDISFVCTATGTPTGTSWAAGVGTASGNSSTGLSDGDNFVKSAVLPSASSDHSVAGVSSYRVSISASTTYYLKARAVFSAGSISAYGRISARRVR